MSQEFVVFIGGFSCEREMYAGEIEKLKESGREVVFFTASDGIDISILVEMGIRQADFVANSQGAETAIEFAILHPEFVRRIVLVNPAGLAGKDRVHRLIVRFFWQLIGEELWTIGRALRRDFRPIMALNNARWPFLKSFAMNIRRRLSKDTPNLVRMDIIPLLRELKRTNASIEVVLLNAHGDRFFKEVRVAKVLGQTEVLFGLFDRWAMYARKGASHNAPYLEAPGTLRWLLGELE